MKRIQFFVRYVVVNYKGDMMTNNQINNMSRNQLIGLIHKLKHSQKFWFVMFVAQSISIVILLYQIYMR